MFFNKTKIGEFDRTITFQKKVVVNNDFNEPEVVSWEDIATDPDVPAKKAEYQGTEQYEADKLTEYRTTTFTIRYRDDVSEVNRIVDDNGLIYDILSITETVRRRILEIKAFTNSEYLDEGGAFSDGFSTGFSVTL